MKRKVLVIGFDGGERAVLDQIATKFELKNLNRMAKTGLSGSLLSTIPANTPTAWSSFQTGMGPGKTGVTDFSYWNKERQETGIVNSTSLPKTLWEQVSEAGLRVGAVNVPLTFPPKKVNGELISGLLTPSLESGFSYPKELKDEIREKFPGYHIFNLKGIKKIDPHRNLDGFLGRMKEVIKNRYLVANYLISNNDYDLFMVHFQANDVVQHALWPYIFSEGSKKQEKIIKQFYLYLDQLVGELIDSFKQNQGGEPMVIVLSDHGFESHTKRFELGRWMVENGYTKINWLFFRKSFRRFYKRYWRPLLSKLSLIDESSNDPLSSWFVWDRSRAFSVGRSGEGFIYLLDQSIKEQIINKLEALVDPGTNRKVIKKVWKREDLYQGDKLEKLPDLVVEPIAGYSCSGTPDHKERFHKINKDEDFHLGKHRQEGIGIISGPGVSKGKLEASIVDIAPTILYYLGVSRDKNIDGKVIIERK